MGNLQKKFVVTPKEPYKDEKTVTMTIRIDKQLQSAFDELSNRSNRSRNELIGMAMQYALENLEFLDDKKNN